MHRIRKRLTVLCSILLSVMFISCFSGCGKHEAGGSAFGAITGALIGTAVAGDNDKGTGLVIGALAGTALGGMVGRSADEEDSQAERDAERRVHHRELAHAEQEKQTIMRQSTKWCSECGKQSSDPRSYRCGPCGGKLCYEKFCNRCGERYQPTVRNAYCTFCEDRVRLCCR